MSAILRFFPFPPALFWGEGYGWGGSFALWRGDEIGGFGINGFGYGLVANADIVR